MSPTLARVAGPAVAGGWFGSSLLPATLAGALLLLCADIAARLVHTNPELRLGVFTALLGTPFFFWLVVRIRKVAP